MLFLGFQQPLEFAFFISESANQLTILVFQILNVQRVDFSESFFDVVQLYLVLSLVFVNLVSELGQLVLQLLPLPFMAVRL